MSMQQPVRIQLGDSGETAVELFFKDIGWGPISTGTQDLGTDLLIQVRDKELFDLRLVLGAQVKTGDSWFLEPAVVDGRDGWWFREADKRHSDYWSNHSIPHLLILQTQDRSTRVWAILSRASIVDTGSGIKVFLPSDQRLEIGFTDAWINFAEAARSLMDLEGSRWSFSIDEVDESSWARHALLVPRLISPHPNKRMSAPIRWAEAISLCIEAEPDWWDRLASQYREVPSPAEAETSFDDGWRLAWAVQQWVTTGESDALEHVALDDARTAVRTAHVVCLAIALVDEGRFAAALEALDAVSNNNEFTVDQAWLNVHRARILSETGNLTDAIELLKRTTVVIASLSNDSTVSAIRSSALWALFELSDILDREFSKIAPALDHHASWWRGQTTANGLEDAVKRIYSTWFRDKTIRLGNANVAHNELFSAALTARLAGDHGSWRRNTTLMAMVDLATDGPQRPVESGSLSALHHAGAHSELGNAVEKIVADGPITELIEALREITPAKFTRTSLRASLEILAKAGRFYPPTQVQEMISVLVEMLINSNALERQYGRYVSRHHVLDALVGLSDSIETLDAHKIIDFTLALEANPDQFLEHGLTSLVRKLDRAALQEHEEDFAQRASNHNLPQWLRNLYAIPAPKARHALQDSLLRGEASAVMSLELITDLSPDEAVALVLTCVVVMEKFRKQRNGFSVYNLDHVQLCTQLALNFPNCGAWEPLIDYICDPEALAGPKRKACKMLAEATSKVSQLNRDRLIDALPIVIKAVKSNPIDQFADPIGGALDELLLELIDPAEDTGSIVGKLLSGDEMSRFDLADYYSRRTGSEQILLSMTRDASYRVSHRAMLALARCISTNPAPASIFVKALGQMAAVDGESNALHILGGLEAATPQGVVLELVLALRSHPSSRVRARAQEIANR
jgi:tetratricopeptide (TPR) repeat protein